MKSYLIERTEKEFNELSLVYSNLFQRWTEVWNSSENHNELYTCYVRLKILAVLIRSCLEYGLIENVTLKTKGNGVSLKNFCNYCIHHYECAYDDDGCADGVLEIYLIINTKKRKEVAFVINKNIDQIRNAVNKMKAVYGE